MSVRHVGVQEAHQLQTIDGYTYVDVRSVPEYENGHPASAHNVPLLHRESQTSLMTPNPDFLAVMPPQPRWLPARPQTNWRRPHNGWLAFDRRGSELRMRWLKCPKPRV